jgi:GTP pyrophosphokinase
MKSNTKTLINKLIKTVRVYIKEENKINLINTAYLYAEKLHRNQKPRQSGEPYITHPLSVALILADLEADENTIAAALLHDTIEDTGITREDIENEFKSFEAFEYGGSFINKGTYIASLVDGVTNIMSISFSSEEEQDAADIRKILNCTDIRVILIKLADRLHNMRTLEFLPRKKQKIKAQETNDFYVPLASSIGLYRIKNELKDLCLKYLNPRIYDRINNSVNAIEISSKPIINKMINNISNILTKNNIRLEKEIIFKRKSISEIYSTLLEEKEINQIHDLLELTVVVESVKDCYTTIGFIHSLYKPTNIIRDFIATPKENMYQSFHTTVFANRYLVKIKIRTKLMDKVASLGLAAYWQDENINMNDEVRKLKFFKNLVNLNNSSKDNITVLDNLKKELFNDKIYVSTPEGMEVKLPVGSTSKDFANKFMENVNKKTVSVIVNNRAVGFNSN